MRQLTETVEILLAEDDHEDVLIFQIALAEIEIPHTLRVANDGDKLFILLEEKIPEILFLDINIPCKDGITCLNAIRGHEDYKHLPIIMYTSNIFGSKIDQCFENGANLYLNKSYTVNELTTKLTHVFAINWKDNPFVSRTEFVLK
jgi:CheY-like chemotaxis protein